MHSTQESKKMENLSIVNPLVLDTLEKLVGRKKKTVKISFESDLQQIYSTVTSHSIQAGEVLIKNLLDFGRSIELILDSYFPIVAEKLGDHWVSDKLTFAEVTLALANLQLLNARFEPFYLSALHPTQKGGRVLVIVPKGENHTLGPISVTRKFRSLGTHSILALDYQMIELEKVLLENTFDLIGISAGNNFMTQKINGLVDFFKTRVEKVTPVVLGGNLVNTYKKTNETLKVDLISKDPEFALDEMGIEHLKQN